MSVRKIIAVQCHNREGSVIFGVKGLNETIVERKIGTSAYQMNDQLDSLLGVCYARGIGRWKDRKSVRAVSKMTY